MEIESTRVSSRRMVDRAAHLLDHVFPDVPVRQWVLSLPYCLRYQLAWDHELCRVVVGVFVRAVLGFLRARARDNDVTDGRGGAVVVIQRFGGSLNAGALSFHSARRLTALDVEEVLATVRGSTGAARDRLVTSRRPRAAPPDKKRSALSDIHVEIPLCPRVHEVRRLPGLKRQRVGRARAAGRADATEHSLARCVRGEEQKNTDGTESDRGSSVNLDRTNPAYPHRTNPAYPLK